MTPLQRSIATRLSPLLIALSLMNSACQKNNLTAKTSDPASTASATYLTPALHFLLWVQQPNLPFIDGIPGDKPLGLISPLGFTINGKGYLCGGMTVTSQTTVEFLNDLWEYDTATKAWTRQATFPGLTRIDGTSFVIGNDAYVQVGNNLWQYDQPTNRWTQKASMPTVARGSASSFALVGMGYVGFGYDITNNTGDLGDFWQYNPTTDAWLQKPGFSAAKREGSASFVIDNNGYIATGGTSTGDTLTYLTDLWEYVPVLSKWVQKPNFPAAGRSSSAGLSANGYGYVATGSNASGFFKDCWEYDDNTQQWLSMPNVGGYPRYSAGAFSIGGNLYIAAGGPGFGDDGWIDFWELTTS